MATAVEKLYPGDAATAAEILELADEYRKAAHQLEALGRKRYSKSWCPFRLCAIHAIELYLNAFLRNRGCAAPTIRGMQHNLAARTDLVAQNGLSLRKTTMQHLHALAESREYLVARYGPETASSLSELTRLKATLQDVAIKVSTKLAQPCTKTALSVPQKA